MPQTSTLLRAGSRLLGTLALTMLFAACDAAEPDIGSPCEVAEDCGGELICDIHDNQGTCQQEHGHSPQSADTDASDADESCAAETRADSFAVGLSKTGAWMSASFVSADPAPPIRGDNTWVLNFSDSDGAALEGLEIVVTPIMPDHGHGTPIEAVVTPTDVAGEYSVTPVNLFMAGYWEITFDVSQGDEQDALVFGFCVE